MSELRALMGAGLDISEHLGLLRGLAMDPDVEKIVEIGFRGGVSAIALISSGKPVTSYDIEKCQPHARRIEELAKNFIFARGDSLKIEIHECELLHIDSLHTYTQLLAELRRHAPKCRKWIAMHDTATFANVGKDGSKPGLLDAAADFLKENQGTWTLHLHLRNNNGMTLLRRVAS